MKLKIYLVSIFWIGLHSPLGAIPHVPFGSHRHLLPSGMILPVQDRALMDKTVAAVYRRWKKAYLLEACTPGQKYIQYKKTGKAATVSEAHGYGMLAVVLMAGTDKESKNDFDALYAYFRAHPIRNNKDLMAWQQDRQCRDIHGVDSATDGDLDIAYSLLLADRQWGSCGEINYLEEARKVIAAIKKLELDTSFRYTTLGSWARPGDDKYDATRGSDFMPGHYRAFMWATRDSDWKSLIDQTYVIVDAIQNKQSKRTGLIPDFIQSPLKNPRPARANFLEDRSDGQVGYNACRVPFRLAADFAVVGARDPRPEKALQKIIRWVEGSPIRGNPSNVVAGYKLNGRPTVKYQDVVFTAPFGAAAIVSAEHQRTLNAFWASVARGSAEGYFGDSIRLLSLIVMSGNWWPPWVMTDPCKGKWKR